MIRVTKAKVLQIAIANRQQDIFKLFNLITCRKLWAFFAKNSCEERIVHPELGASNSS